MMRAILERSLIWPWISILALLLRLISPAHAADESWRPIELRCAEEISAAQCPNGETCDGMWPYYAVCTAQRVWGQAAAQSPKLDACIHKIWRDRFVKHVCAACGDPVAEALYCAFRD